MGSSQTADQRPASSRKIIAIEVKGSKRFAPADVIAASGLQIGTVAVDEDFKRAVRQLGETGAFADVAYKYSYNDEGTKLEFDVTDATEFVPVRFVDFVWFTPDQLMKAVRQYVPLFTGELPLGGNMPGQVSDVLQAQLVEKAVPGTVQYERIAHNGPVQAFEYSVTNVVIRIDKIEFAGAQAPELPLLQDAADNMPQRSYSQAAMQQFIQRQLLPIYRARGYLKAEFGTPQPTVIPTPAADAGEGSRNTTFVDVSLGVTPGEQYALSKLNWIGNQEIPTTTLAGMVVAPEGKPLDAVRLGDELKAVKNLYASKGYLMASVKANATFDDAARTVTIELAVDEDAVYHMGDLQYRGVDNLLMAKLRDAWSLQKGQVYDAGYLKQYLQDSHHLLPANLDWEVAPHVTANIQDKSVDVDIQYTAKATQ